MYMPMNNTCMDIAPSVEKAGLSDGYDLSTKVRHVPGANPATAPVGRIDAISASTGKTRWSYQQRAPIYGSVLATGGNLVFGGDIVRRFRALDAETGAVVCDLTAAGQRAVVARGGRGGRGNMNFATPTNRAPRRAEPGTPGERRDLRLELRVLADAGLLGFPNVGKSTLIRAVSAARPRVADYPFTTLVPHLGVVRIDMETSFVLADIPGLIEGAHAGHGLGARFLRHLSRTAVLVHLLDISGLTGRDPLADFDALNRELALASAALAEKPQIVVAGKLDLAETRAALPAVTERFAARGIELHAVSGATGEGTRELVMRIAGAVHAARSAA
jgi:Obg family GTPase CgtA